MKELTLHLNNMKILSYEVGNVNKIKSGLVTARPVCALMLEDRTGRYKVKALFKYQKALDVDKYIVNRRCIGDITNETVELTADVRELRNDCLVVDNVQEVWFDVSVGI